MHISFKKVLWGFGAATMLLTAAPVLAEDSADYTNLTFYETGLNGSNIADLSADAANWAASEFSGYKKAGYALISDEAFTGISVTTADLTSAFDEIKLMEIHIKGRYLLEGLDEIIGNALNDNGPMVTPAGVSFYVNSNHTGLIDNARYSESKSYLEKFLLPDNERIDQTVNVKVILDEKAYQASKIFKENGEVIVSADSDDAITLAEAVESYVSKKLKGDLGDAYSNPFGDFRVRNASFADLSYDAENDIYTYSMSELPNEGQIAWVYVQDELLRSKLQGIIGNTLYRGSFMATINDSPIEDTCGETRYGVWVPITTEKEGTFTIRYAERMGNTTNFMILAVGVSTMMMLLLVFTMTRKPKKTSYRYRG